MSISNNITVLHYYVNQSLFNQFFVYIFYLDKCCKYHFSKSSIDVMLRFLEFELMIITNYNYHGYSLINTFWKY
jgi:hypothetical protein